MYIATPTNPTHLRYIVIDVFGRVCEQSLKRVPGPIQRVLDGVGKVLVATDRDRILWVEP